MSIRWGDNKSNNKVENTPAPVSTSIDSDLSIKDKDFSTALTNSERPRLVPEVKPSTGIPSTISQLNTFTGTISGEADLIILGECVDDIILPRNSLNAGPTSRIKANIIADKAQTEGELTGDLCAHEVKILKTGVVFSNIVSPRVSVEDGAKIKGSIDMDEQLTQEKFEKFNNLANNTTSSKLMSFKDRKNLPKDDYISDK